VGAKYKFPIDIWTRNDWLKRILPEEGMQTIEGIAELSKQIEGEQYRIDGKVDCGNIIMDALKHYHSLILEFHNLKEGLKEYEKDYKNSLRISFYI